MNRINIPGFTADASLSRTKEQYQRLATRVRSRGGQEVIAQAPAGGASSWDVANWVHAKLGFGRVHCESVCPEDPKQTQFCKEVCYWWPE
jgi:hypothetical protein